MRRKFDVYIWNRSSKNTNSFNLDHFAYTYLLQHISLNETIKLFKFDKLYKMGK